MTVKILVRYGEIALKGKNRGQFEQKLHQNLKDAVGRFDAAVVRMHGRFMVQGPEYEKDKIVTALKGVFGVVSVSPVIEMALDLETIKSSVERTIITFGSGKSFKIASRRANKKFPCTSPELNRIMGEHVLRIRPDLKVDLDRPDLTLSIEIGYDKAYLYFESSSGPGGLPLGITGKALLLLSGGIDSPVAGWLAMKRGLRIETLHFHSFPFTGKKSQEKTVELCRKLARYSGRINLHMINVAEIQQEIRANCEPDLAVILLRRMMIRLAEKLSASRQLDALVTGENLGQVASQTLESINVIGKGTEMLILRPLIGFDKGEIIKRAIKIGTYETSILPFEDCCTLFVPKSPVTKPRLPIVEENEARLDIKRLISRAYSSLENETIER